LAGFAEGDLSTELEGLGDGLVGGGEGAGVEGEDGLVGVGVERGCYVEEFWGGLLVGWRTVREGGYVPLSLEKGSMVGSVRCGRCGVCGFLGEAYGE